MAVNPKLYPRFSEQQLNRKKGTAVKHALYFPTTLSDVHEINLGTLVSIVSGPHGIKPASGKLIDDTRLFKVHVGAHTGHYDTGTVFVFAKDLSPVKVNGE